MFLFLLPNSSEEQKEWFKKRTNLSNLPGHGEEVFVVGRLGPAPEDVLVVYSPVAVKDEEFTALPLVVSVEVSAHRSVSPVDIKLEAAERSVFFKK